MGAALFVPSFGACLAPNCVCTSWNVLFLTHFCDTLLSQLFIALLVLFFSGQFGPLFVTCLPSLFRPSRPSFLASLEGANNTPRAEVATEVGGKGVKATGANTPGVVSVGKHGGKRGGRRQGWWAMGVTLLGALFQACLTPFYFMS